MTLMIDDCRYHMTIKDTQVTSWSSTNLLLVELEDIIWYYMIMSMSLLDSLIPPVTCLCQIQTSISTQRKGRRSIYHATQCHRLANYFTIMAGLQQQTWNPARMKKVKNSKCFWFLSFWLRHSFIRQSSCLNAEGKQVSNYFHRSSDINIIHKGTKSF